jgi:hypothetical protein
MWSHVFTSIDYLHPSDFVWVRYKYLANRISRSVPLAVKGFRPEPKQHPLGSPGRHWWSVCKGRTGAIIADLFE